MGNCQIRGGNRDNGTDCANGVGSGGGLFAVFGGTKIRTVTQRKLRGF